MGKRFHLPSLPTLRAIEASARTGSFTEAAKVLNLTQSAVSHAVKGVEAAMGRRLFLRRHQEAVPTRTALDLAQAIRRAIHDLEEAFQRATEDGNRLSVKVQPTVAMRWLMPRLGDFKKAHPAIDLRVTIGWDAVDFAAERFDAGLVWNPVAEDGVVATHLFDAEMIPVAAPAYLRGRDRTREPAPTDRIIHNEATGRTWANWLAVAGLAADGFEPVITTDTDDAAIRLAAAGQGITLSVTRFVEADLALGSLVPVGAGHRLRNGAYYLVGVAERVDAPAFIAFRDWLIGQTAGQQPE